ncbi:serine protease [Corallococcus praedator]|uniref:Serine protease n=1 Tax=Corallococcus praedator TaxID=2316724 RepID=A0ABX9QHE2_9BACT|nr:MULTISPECIES: trypsin-like peptidase domain-containing protein [Corallococcus]RKH21420.1 serine protease [Corallococcus sp. CA047B]RKH35073.1 serine protease [Corallococcus sp. CA031C]RKI07337.1 serine protease [Corallococcus praedator]
MFRPLLFVLALLCLLVTPTRAGAEARPSRADLQRVLELHARSVVRVRGPQHAGPGIIVGADGQVLTAVAHVGPQSAQVEHAGNALTARVVLSSTVLQVAVVAGPQGAWPAAPVRLVPEGLAGRWVVGVTPGGKGRRDTPRAAKAKAAPAPFFDVPLTLAPGSPLYDGDGRLVAVVVERRGKAVRALPLSAVKAELASADAP